MSKLVLLIALLSVCCVVLTVEAGPLREVYRRATGLTGSRGVHSTRAPKSTLKSNNAEGPKDPGQPLFLSPYIERGDIAGARAMSEVNPPVGGIPSYSGYFTVNSTCGSNMFFWFFPALSGNLSAPVLLWLQGGPGGSSMFGLLGENGPIYIDEDLNVLRRDVTWSNKYHMLYIDNPVGTGFSFTGRPECYATNEEDVSRDLYSALVQFFTVFPELVNNEFYVTGESYAGKYVPSIAFKIHTENTQSTPPALFINLKGVAIGDGWCDPETMVPEYPNLMYYFGLADALQTLQVRAWTDNIVWNILKGNWEDAYHLWDALLNGDATGYPSYFTNITGSTDYYNILETQQPLYYPNLDAFFKQDLIRYAIHVGSLPFNEGDEVEYHLRFDIMQSVKPKVAVLMENYKVLIYSGQLDVIVGAPLTEAFVRSIDWSGQIDYKRANRFIWKVQKTDTEVAGYVRQVGKFVYALVRGGGHILPNDQPERAFDMIYRFVENLPFSDIVPPQ